MLKYQIQVVDNGIGISKENLQIIGQRFMTSKLQNLKQLDQIPNTYGYKGEALASMRKVVGSINVISKTDHAQYSSVITLFNDSSSEIVETKQRPSKGTTITVDNVFKNFPVRQKSVNSNVDLEDIRQTFEYISFVHPEVSFTLRNDVSGKMIFRSHRFNNSLESIASVHKNIDIKALTSIDFKKRYVKVTGIFYKKPYESNKIQLIYVNKIPVQSPVIQDLANKKLMKSSIFCESSRIKTRFPVFILDLSCPYSQVCVEDSAVEFKNWDFIQKCISKTIKHFFKKEHLLIVCNDANLEDQNQETTAESNIITQITGIYKSAPTKRRAESTYERDELSKHSKNSSYDLISNNDDINSPEVNLEKDSGEHKNDIQIRKYYCGDESIKQMAVQRSRATSSNVKTKDKKVDAASKNKISLQWGKRKKSFEKLDNKLEEMFLSCFKTSQPKNCLKKLEDEQFDGCDRSVYNEDQTKTPIKSKNDPIDDLPSCVDTVIRKLNNSTSNNDAKSVILDIFLKSTQVYRNGPEEDEIECGQKEFETDTVDINETIEVQENNSNLLPFNKILQENKEIISSTVPEKNNLNTFVANFIRNSQKNCEQQQSHLGFNIFPNDNTTNDVSLKITELNENNVQIFKNIAKGEGKRYIMKKFFENTENKKYDEVSSNNSLEDFQEQNFRSKLDVTINNNKVTYTMNTTSIKIQKNKPTAMRYVPELKKIKKADTHSECAQIVPSYKNTTTKCIQTSFNDLHCNNSTDSSSSISDDSRNLLEITEKPHNTSKFFDTQRISKTKRILGKTQYNNTIFKTIKPINRFPNPEEIYLGNCQLLYCNEYCNETEKCCPLMQSFCTENDKNYQSKIKLQNDDVTSDTENMDLEENLFKKPPVANLMVSSQCQSNYENFKHKVQSAKFGKTSTPMCTEKFKNKILKNQNQLLSEKSLEAIGSNSKIKPRSPRENLLEISFINDTFIENEDQTTVDHKNEKPNSGFSIFAKDTNENFMFNINQQPFTLFEDKAHNSKVVDRSKDLFSSASVICKTPNIPTNETFEKSNPNLEWTLRETGNGKIYISKKTGTLKHFNLKLFNTIFYLIICLYYQNKNKNTLSSSLWVNLQFLRNTIEGRYEAFCATQNIGIQSTSVA